MLATVLAALGLAGVAAGQTVPASIVEAVHGRVVGWAATGGIWFVVYADRAGGDWCGLRGASWRIALVDPTKAAVVTDLAVGPAMCGNEVAWTSAGHYTDGRHAEVAFMLWTTPSIGARTSIYRVEGGRLHRIAVFWGDQVSLGRGTVTIGWEHRGRSPKGELRDVYRWNGVGYRLVSQS